MYEPLADFSDGGSYFCKNGIISMQAVDSVILDKIMYNNLRKLKIMYNNLRKLKDNVQ